MNKVKSKIHEIIFEADTPMGKLFDILLLVMILLSVIVVMLESVETYRLNWAWLFDILEWVFTILFSVEYLLRIYSVKNPLKYIFSFYGIIDLLSLIPSFIGLGLGTNNISSIKNIRTIRLIRIFRILKLIRYVKEAAALKKAFIASKQRIIIFLFIVVSIAILMGTIIYMLEDPKDGFTSIPRSIYWAIVTLTTVGYGDIAPQTPIGQFFASIIMILGYSIIAVPTGLISVELSKISLNTQSCRSCSLDEHEDDAVFCKLCGEELNPIS
jgi:voltage-gated potassium channel